VAAVKSKKSHYNVLSLAQLITSRSSGGNQECI